MLNARVAVHFVGQRIDIPGLSIGLPIMLAAKIEDFVLESFVTVPAMTREDTAILEDMSRLAFVDANERNIVRSITQFSGTVESADGNPTGPLSAQDIGPSS